MAERLTTNKGQCEACIGCIEESNCKVECGAIDDCLEKLAEYETAEEEGRLVVLPCKIGDKVFFADVVKGAISIVVSEIRIQNDGVEITANYDGDDKELKYWGIYFNQNEIGEKVWFTRKEAEEAAKRKVRRKNGGKQ